MARAFILLLDSFGIGAAGDAEKFGDSGADTFGHIDRDHHPHLPNMTRWGLRCAAAKRAAGPEEGVETAYGYAQEQGYGKDTPSGHWEIAGAPVFFEWGYFPKTVPCFPEALIQALVKEGNLPGVLGNKHASGTTIIEEYGEEHLKTGKPIVYTSADSVFQIAAHEAYFGLQKLYDLCDIARKLVDPFHIGRVIARPFLGEVGSFYRTGNRRDISIPPPSVTLLDKLVEAGREVISIGKVADIFAHRGITQKVKGDGNDALFAALLNTAKTAPEGSLAFVNFVDFDMLYGHRRDAEGYARALERFDQQLPDFEHCLKEDDIALITADHGCDPTWDGSDHTREYIPVLMFGKKIKPRFLGKRESFADIGQTIAAHLGISPLDYGKSFLK